MIDFQVPAIVGGTVLIIERIESQNFVTGVSGWAIFADGTAEFLDVLIRGSLITGVPPNRRIEINGAAYPDSIAFFTGEVGEVEPGRVESQSFGNGANLTLYGPTLADSAGDPAYIEIEALDGQGTNVEINAGSIRIEGNELVINGFDTGPRVGDSTEFLRFVASTLTRPLYLAHDQHHGFTTPTMLNSWVDFGVTYQPVGYRLDPDGYVTLRGLVKSGSAANAVMFNLPSGLRPIGGAHRQSSVANSALCEIFVSTNGNVNATVGGSTAWTSLNGIRFPVF